MHSDCHAVWRARSNAIDDTRVITYQTVGVEPVRLQAKEDSFAIVTEPKEPISAKMQIARGLLSFFKCFITAASYSDDNSPGRLIVILG